MKQYYKGNVEILRIKNLTINPSTPRIIQERVIINQDILFYKNRLGVIIRFEDKCPIPTYKEVIDYMTKHINGESGPGTYTSGAYVVEDSLQKVEITKKKEKELIKERQQQKKITKKNF